MTDNKKIELIDRILQCDTDKQAVYYIRALRNKKLLKTDKLDLVLDALDYVSDISIKDYIILASMNDKLIDDNLGRFLDTLISSNDYRCKLYLSLSYIDYIMDNKILFDLIEVISLDNFNEVILFNYLDNVINNLLKYNNVNNNISSSEFVQLVGVFGNANSHMEGYFYSEVLRDRRVLDNHYRVEIAKDICTEDNFKNCRESIADTLDSVISRSIERVNKKHKNNKYLALSKE